MITPDTKDWTWVLDRPCPDCGFDAASCASPEVPELLRANAVEWRRLLEAGALGSARPDDDTWSPLEYACHVRDVFRIMDGRVGLMLSEDDPRFPNWDQDATAVDDRYAEQDPATVVSDLESAAEALATRLEAVSGAEWSRPGRRSDGAAFTVASIATYMIHDPIHHIWDVTGQRT